MRRRPTPLHYGAGNQNVRVLWTMQCSLCTCAVTGCQRMSSVGKVIVKWSSGPTPSRRKPATPKTGPCVLRAEIEPADPQIAYLARTSRLILSVDEAISRSHRTTKKATTGLSARPILTAMSPRANPALDELTPDSDPGPLPWQPLVDYALDAAAGVMLSFFGVQVVFPQGLWDRPAQSHISPLSTEEL